MAHPARWSSDYLLHLRHDLDGLGETRPEDDLVAVVSAELGDRDVQGKLCATERSHPVGASHNTRDRWVGGALVACVAAPVDSRRHRL